MKFRRITALSMAAAMAISAGVMANAADLTAVDQQVSTTAANVVAPTNVEGSYSYYLTNKKTVDVQKMTRNDKLPYFKIAVQNRSACDLTVKVRKGSKSGTVVDTMRVPASDTKDFHNNSKNKLSASSEYYIEITPTDGSKVMNATVWYKTADTTDAVLSILEPVTE